MGETFDLIMNACRFAGVIHFFVACGDSPISYIVHDCVIKQNRVLRNNSNTIAKTKMSAGSSS